ncbi:hypothetical protein POPTR_005G232650v4 [Populus trichocarpa]|uniref:Uncharacterized protein n=1 Tax=Populus trichocarpa TaxID=3694 RepID=A0ACC0T278_POPTR|nr:hypothetical protein BDE02_05G197600 [Populus trichocarpa]KAI9395415.1 hypothetical protein POPTR_005G232650v4 [Populus trichocarpa]
MCSSNILWWIYMMWSVDRVNLLPQILWKLPNVTFLKVDVDELKSVAQEWDVQAMPTFIFLKDGEIVEKFTGVN